MTLHPTGALIAEAREDGVGVPAFNVLHIETATALAAAAEETGVPIILQISENCVRYHGGLAGITAATKAIAEGSGGRLALHLDHANDPDLVDEALALGFGSVMFDAAHLPFAENVASTRAVAARAHDHGVWVEAELGEIGGKEGAHAPGVRTDPAEASQFVDATGVDALAVAVGSQHAMTERSAGLDLDLIARLRETLAVPLVLHGSSGVADAEIQRGIAAGMTKINVSTQLNKVFTAALRARLAEAPELVDSRKYFAPATRALKDEAARLARVIAGVGR